MTIRNADYNDVDALLELGRQMHAESWYAYLPFDDDKVRNALCTAITRGFLAVHEVDGRVLGAMAGVITEFWFCHSRIATDLGLFVRSDKRGSAAAVRLVQAFIDWAKKNGAAEVSLAISTGVRIEETGDLYKALGLTHVGGVYKGRLP